MMRAILARFGYVRTADASAAPQPGPQSLGRAFVSIRSRPFLKDKPKMSELRKPPLAEFALHALDARARAKLVVAQMQGIRNPASPAALQIADDLMAIANSFELLANDVRWAAKCAAANCAR